MNVTVEQISKNRIKLEIALTKEEFQAGMDRSFQKNRNRFNVPGFRKGKAPRKMVESMYGEGVFYEDAVNFLIPDYYDKAVEENKLEPVAQPEIDVTHIAEEDAPLTFTAEVDVKPEVVLGAYTGLDIETPVYEVTEEEVNDRINMAREQNARMISVEEGAENGNVVTIDFEGFLDGKPFPNGKAESYDLELGSGSFIPGFEEQIVGMKKGEEKEIDVTFPEDYFSEDLKGKSVKFEIKMHEVKKKELPEIDDEFASEVSNFDTLAEYKNSIEAELKHANELRAEREVKEKILEQVSNNAQMELPQSMIDAEANAMYEDFKKSLSYRGLTLEQYLKYNNMDEEKIRAEFKEDAIKNIKSRLTVEEIGKTEKIEVSEDDVKAELQKMAESYQRPVEEIERVYGGSMGESLRLNLLWDKTIDFLVKNNQKH